MAEHAEGGGRDVTRPAHHLLIVRARERRTRTRQGRDEVNSVALEVSVLTRLAHAGTKSPHLGARVSCPCRAP